MASCANVVPVEAVRAIPAITHVLIIFSPDLSRCHHVVQLIDNARLCPHAGTRLRKPSGSFSNTTLPQMAAISRVSGGIFRRTVPGVLAPLRRGLSSRRHSVM